MIKEKFCACQTSCYSLILAPEHLDFHFEIAAPDIEVINTFLGFIYSSIGIHDIDMTKDVFELQRQQFVLLPSFT